MSLSDIPWRTTCHGRLAEVQTSSGWLRLIEDGDGWLVTRFGVDQMPVGEPERMSDVEAEAALVA